MTRSVVAFNEINDIIHDPSRLEVDNAIRLKPKKELKKIFARQRRKLIIAKPLMESQRAAELLNEFPNSVGLWLLRDYRAVANSMIEKWGSQAGFVQLLPILYRQGTWREENIPEEIAENVRRFADPKMPHADGCALFWYARNALFLSQRLGDHPRATVVQYEKLVTKPGYLSARLRTVGIECKIKPDFYTNASLNKGNELQISESIAGLCDDLTSKLVESSNQRPATPRKRLATLTKSRAAAEQLSGFWRKLPILRHTYRQRDRADHLREKNIELCDQRDSYKRRYEALKQRFEAIVKRDSND